MSSETGLSSSFAFPGGKSVSGFGSKEGHQAKRRPLGDITDANQYQDVDRKSYPPVEQIHMPPPPAKYHGVEYGPSEESWFDIPVKLEPMEFLDETHWKV
jgi:hypothetical protein